MKTKKMTLLAVAITVLALNGCSLSRLYQMQQRGRSYDYEQINFKDLTNRYFLKDQPSVGTIEGIYSVSIVIIKKGKGLLSSTEKEKTVERKENYSKVAILRDPGKANREYLEISMDKDYQTSYSVVGEFTKATDGSLLVYKHFEPKGKSVTYNFIFDRTSDVLEGVRTENNGAFTYTYKLTYLKLLPKSK
jgi:hypothetical protein